MKRTLRTVLGLASAALFCVSVDAQGGGPFRDRRIVSPSGKHYAVLRAVASIRPGPWELVRRRDGVEPIRPKLENWSLRGMERITGIDPREEVSRDPADRLVATAQFDQLPAKAAVSDAPVGIVAFDQHGRLGTGRTVWFLGPLGDISWSVDLDDLFAGTPRDAFGDTGSLHWSTHFEVDPERKSAWVVTRGHELREISLQDGRVSTPGADAILGWLGSASDAGRLALLVALQHGELPRDERRGPLLSRLAEDDERPMLLRLRATVVAAREGSEEVGATVFMGGLLDTAPEVRRYARIHYAESTPSDGLPYLLALVDGQTDDSTILEPAWIYGEERLWMPELIEAFRRLGVDAVEALRTRIDDETTPTAPRLLAATILWRLDDSRIPNGVRRAVRSGDRRMLTSLVTRRPVGTDELLLECLRNGAPDPIGICAAYESLPDPRAIPFLEAALTEFEQPAWRERLEASLAACRELQGI